LIAVVCEQSLPFILYRNYVASPVAGEGVQGGGPEQELAVGEASLLRTLETGHLCAASKGHQETKKSPSLLVPEILPLV
jgi:hypothetical protein